MNNSQYHTQNQRVFVLVHTYFLILTTIYIQRINFSVKILSILKAFKNRFLEYYFEYTVRWSIKCHILLIVQESYVFFFFRDAG